MKDFAAELCSCSHVEVRQLCRRSCGLCVGGAAVDVDLVAPIFARAPDNSRLVVLGAQPTLTPQNIGAGNALLGSTVSSECADRLVNCSLFVSLCAVPGTAVPQLCARTCRLCDARDARQDISMPTTSTSAPLLPLPTRIACVDHVNCFFYFQALQQQSATDCDRATAFYCPMMCRHPACAQGECRVCPFLNMRAP